MKLPDAPSMLMLGVAGVGKTHAVCDAAEQRAARGLLSVVLFAERLHAAATPWEQVRSRLGLPPTLAPGEVLGLLDAAGEASGAPLLLCIDGLNETQPRSYWRQHLAELLGQAARFPWIKLCLTCRSTYAEQVIPAHLQLPTVEHTGFHGLEFDACRAYFTHYHLEPPIGPVLQPEFENPLFLRLICEAVRDAGMVRVPSGWHGIYTAVQAFLSAKNRVYSLEFGTEARFRRPERGLAAFTQALRMRQRTTLPWDEAAAIIDVASFSPGNHPAGSLMEWLIREGMLIVDAADRPLEAPGEEVRVAFERLGDHLLVSSLLEPLDRASLDQAISDGGALAFLLADVTALSTYAGVLEALAVQVPERFGVELPDLLEQRDLERSWLLELLVNTLVWRDPAHVTERTRLLLLEGFCQVNRAAGR